MANYEAASRTKTHFERELLEQHREIVSIAPQLKLDENGNPTEDAVIVVGVTKINRITAGEGGGVVNVPPEIPSELPVISLAGVPEKDETIEVIIEEEGDIRLVMNTAKRRPCPGGYSIGHYAITAGTLGGVARVGSTWGYILSNNHILAAQNSGQIGDSIYQPGPHDGGTSSDLIGRLERFVPVTVGGNNEVDAAFAQALDPWDQNVSRHVKDIGTPNAVADPTVGQNVRKSGRTTQLTTGRVLSTNATVRLQFGGGLTTFVNQIQTSKMVEGGDSGSLLWASGDLTVVGMVFATSSTVSYSNKINRVLTLLSQANRVVSIEGKESTFEEIELSLI